jgi:hypothetical protein
MTGWFLCSDYIPFDVRHLSLTAIFNSEEGDREAESKPYHISRSGRAENFLQLTEPSSSLHR